MPHRLTFRIAPRRHFEQRHTLGEIKAACQLGLGQVGHRKHRLEVHGHQGVLKQVLSGHVLRIAEIGVAPVSDIGRGAKHAVDRRLAQGHVLLQQWQ